MWSRGADIHPPPPPHLPILLTLISQGGGGTGRPHTESFRASWPYEFRGSLGWLPDFSLPISISEGKEMNENKEHKHWINFISLFEHQEIGLFLAEMDLNVK